MQVDVLDDGEQSVPHVGFVARQQPCLPVVRQAPCLCQLQSEVRPLLRFGGRGERTGALFPLDAP